MNWDKKRIEIFGEDSLDYTFHAVGEIPGSGEILIPQDYITRDCVGSIKGICDPNHDIRVIIHSGGVDVVCFKCGEITETFPTWREAVEYWNNH